jgi:uroporphyrinogen-III synthase
MQVMSRPLILVTRSGAAGEALCRSLREHGETAEVFSPVRLEGPEDAPACRQSLLAMLPCDRLIAPSAEALRQAVSLVGIAPLRDHSLIVPGEGTAKVASELGFAKVSYPLSGGTSEDILDLPALQSVDGLQIVVLAAEGGRRTLGQELIKRGARVSRLHVYRRVPVAAPEDLEAGLMTAASVITLLASGGALSGLESAMSPAAWSHLLSGIMVAPSARVAAMARRSGAAHVEVAAGADDESMLSALNRARRNRYVCGTLGSKS